MNRIKLSKVKSLVKICLVVTLVSVLALAISQVVNRFTELIVSTQNQLIQLQDEVTNLRKEVASLKKTTSELSEQLKEEKSQSETPQGTSTAESYTPRDYSYYDTGFRSWMSSSAITDTGSSQYKVVSLAETDSNGLLVIDGKPVVALGSGWSLRVGDTARVTTDKTTYDVVVGDIKADSHTDSSCKVTVHNGCVVEFVVDSSALNSQIRISGNVATLSQYRGKVLSIQKTGRLL